MKLCSFIILAAFEFGIMDLIRQNCQIKVIAKILAYTVYHKAGKLWWGKTLVNSKINCIWRNKLWQI